MKIEEKNKLIAEFMGGYLNMDSVQSSNEWIFPDFHTNELLYHSSWDWLMPVIEKANKICNEKGQDLSNRSREQKHLSNQLDNPLHWKSWSYHYIGLSTDINMVYKKTVDFIEWHNNAAHAKV